MLEADHVLHEELKERLRKEYIRRVKKCLKSKLNGGNMVKAINTWAESLISTVRELLSGLRQI